MTTSAALDENVWILAAQGLDDQNLVDTSALEIISAVRRPDIHLSATFPLFIQWKRQFGTLGRQANFPAIMAIFKHLAYTSKIEWVPTCKLNEPDRTYLENRFGPGDLEVTRSAAGSTRVEKILATSDNPLRQGISATGIDTRHNFHALSIRDARSFLLS